MKNSRQAVKTVSIDLDWESVEELEREKLARARERKGRVSFSSVAAEVLADWAARRRRREAMAGAGGGR